MSPNVVQSFEMQTYWCQNSIHKPSNVCLCCPPQTKTSKAKRRIERESQETGRGRAKVKESKGQGCHATYWYSIHTPLYFSLHTPTSTGDTPLQTETHTTYQVSFTYKHATDGRNQKRLTLEKGCTWGSAVLLVIWHNTFFAD